MTNFEFKNVFYQKASISDSNKVLSASEIEIITPKLKNDGACLINAYEVAKITDSKCVEGFVFCMVANGSQVDDKVIRHCWNMKNGIHFDLTNEKVWTGLPGKAKEFIYYTVGEYNHVDYTNSAVNGEIKFLSDVVRIAQEIDDEWQKEINK